MKKFILLVVTFMAIVGIKMNADSNASPLQVDSSVNSIPPEHPFLCMWDGNISDCRGGGANYCICVQ